MAFDESGARSARFDFPRVHRLLWVGGDHLLAIERDALDVERIAVYDLPPVCVAVTRTPAADDTPIDTT